MKPSFAFLLVVLFSAACALGLYLLGVGDHHSNLLWAAGTSIALVAILVVAVWMFFTLTGDRPFKWELEDQ